MNLTASLWLSYPYAGWCFEDAQRTPHSLLDTTTAISPSAPLVLLNLCTAGVAVENSTQYKTVLDALRARKDRFAFEDVEIALRPSVMAFITMNPGYPGRAGASTQIHAL